MAGGRLEPAAVYTEHFDAPGAAEQYLRKFQHRVERLRHRIECDILARHLHGRLLDLTVACGRFVGQLPRVTEYCGRDYSQPFLDYVRRHHPRLALARADLREPLAEPDAGYDSVVCLRTLSALPFAHRVLPEMARVLRPGGTMVFDYGLRASESLMKGQTLSVDAEPVAEILAPLPLELERRYPVDAMLTRLKSHPRLYRLVGSRAGRVLPDALLRGAEALSSSWLATREILVLRRR